MAGDVITTGTGAADTARVDAPGGTDPVTDAEQAEAGAANVPGRRAAEDPDVAAETPAEPAGPDRPGGGPARTSRARAAVAAAAGQAADVAASGVGVRRRLARLGAQRGTTLNPVLEPLIKTVRATHPKADVRLIERAYDTAAYWHRDQKRLSGDPYITHPLAVATILAELGMNTDTICAALLHDTVEDTPYSLTELRGEFGEDIAALVDGVTKLDKVKYGESAEAETVRKMVVAMPVGRRVVGPLDEPDVRLRVRRTHGLDERLEHGVDACAALRAEPRQPPPDAHDGRRRVGGLTLHGGDPGPLGPGCAERRTSRRPGHVGRSRRGRGGRRGFCVAVGRGRLRRGRRRLGLFRVLGWVRLRGGPGSAGGSSDHLTGHSRSSHRPSQQCTWTS